MRLAIGILLFCALFCLPSYAGAQKQVKPIKGFANTLSKASLALYASSELDGVTNRLTCSATIFQKSKDGYLVISAGHCTPVNGELPPDLVFSVADTVGGKLSPVILLKAKLEGTLDYSIFDFPTKDKYPVVPLGNDDNLQIGEQTINFNFSRGTTKEYSPGIVVSDYINQAGASDTDWAKGLFEVQEFASDGASGSSIVDPKSKSIIGLIIGGTDGTLPAFVEPIDLVVNDLANKPVSDKPMKFTTKAMSCEDLDKLLQGYVGMNIKEVVSKIGEPTSMLIGYEGNLQENSFAFSRVFVGPDKSPYFIEFEFVANPSGVITSIQIDACGENGNLLAPPLSIN